jgi:hypothetical protein
MKYLFTYAVRLKKKRILYGFVSGDMNLLEGNTEENIACAAVEICKVKGCDPKDVKGVMFSKVDHDVVMSIVNDYCGRAEPPKLLEKSDE